MEDIAPIIREGGDLPPVIDLADDLHEGHEVSLPPLIDLEDDDVSSVNSDEDYKSDFLDTEAEEGEDEEEEEEADEEEDEDDEDDDDDNDDTDDEDGDQSADDGQQVEEEMADEEDNNPGDGGSEGEEDNDDEGLIEGPDQQGRGLVDFINNIHILRLKKCPFASCINRSKFRNASELVMHFRLVHVSDYNLFIQQHEQQHGLGNTNIIELRLSASLYNGKVKAYELVLGNMVHTDLLAFLSLINNTLRVKLEESLHERIPSHGTELYQFKTSFSISSLYEKGIGADKESQVHSFTTPFYEVWNTIDVKSALTLYRSYLLQRNDDYTHQGSGWVFVKVIKFQFMVIKTKAFHGGGKWEHKSLPTVLQHKKGSLLNVYGSTNRCFAHAILSVFEYLKLLKTSSHFSNTQKRDMIDEDKRRIVSRVAFYEKLMQDNADIITYTKRDFYHEDSYPPNCPEELRIDFTNVNYPMSLKDIEKFQKANKDLGLFILGYDLGSKPINHLTNKNKRLNVEVREDDDDDEDDPEEDHNMEFRANTDTSMGSVSPSMKWRKKQQDIRRKMHPLYITPYKTNIMVDIMYIYNDQNEGHFIGIENMHSLLNTGKSPANSQLCKRCLCFVREELLPAHSEYCSQFSLQKVNMPTVDLEFTAYNRTLKSPFTFFLDFECLLLKNYGPLTEEQFNQQCAIKQHTHEACGWSWVCIDHDNNLVEKRVFRKNPEDDPDLDVGKECLRSLLTYAGEKQTEIQLMQTEAKATMLIPPEWQEKFNNPFFDYSKEKCFLCKKGFKLNDEFEDHVEGLSKKDKKSNHIVKHHSHLPPYEFVGLCHNQCNLKAPIRQSFTCFAHNFTGYDSHIVTLAADKTIAESVDIIGSSTEKFTSVTINHTLRFVDSLSFFGGASLEATVNSLEEKDKDFFRNNIKSFLLEEGLTFNDELIRRLETKGAYPYSYMDSYERFKETSLPEKEKFFNDLSEESIDDGVYNNALALYNGLGVRNLGQWHDMYVYCDTLLLATCFIKLRNVMFESFGLCITHYLSLPMFSLDACLKYSNEYVELIKDPSMYVFLENSVRGGLCTIGDLRAASANNNFCEDGRNDEKETSFLLDLDFNNLYGNGLSSLLPHSHFKWLEDKEITKINMNVNKHLKRLSNVGPYGQLLEVDVEYPEELHDYFNSFPPCPSKRTIKEKEISQMQVNLGKMLGLGSTPYKVEKMVACLKPKTIICHYRTLKYYASIGLKIKRVNRGIKFIQKAWMKDYISYNSKKRQETSSPVEQNLRKFLNNSLFGKTIQNVRQRVNMILIQDEDRYMRYAKKPTLKQLMLLPSSTSSDLSLAVLSKNFITLNSPMPIGVTVLEEAKLCMYKFFYGFLKKNFKNLSLMYSDTDSLIIKVYTKNAYAVMKKHMKNYFDMSGYKKGHPVWGKYYDPTNKKVPAYMKDELANSIMTRFVGLKSKLYSFEYAEEDKSGKYSIVRETVKAKGIKRSAIKKHTRFEQYAKCIEDMARQTFVSFRSIRSFRHRLYTLMQKKRCLNAFDNKRYFLCAIRSLALGHKDIPLYSAYYNYGKRIRLGKYFPNAYEVKCFLRQERNAMIKSQTVQDCLRLDDSDLGRKKEQYVEIDMSTDTEDVYNERDFAY